MTIGTNTRAYGTEVVSGTTTPKSNRLKTLSNPAVSLTHLATGQTLSDDGRASYTHYLNGRIKSITLPGGTKSVVFTYDADGRRVRKYTQNLVSGTWVVDQASVVHYVYDLAGHVLGEYNGSGVPLREYIWVGDMPVALFTPGATASAAPVLYYIHTDHLNTPRAVMDTAGNLRWRWIADPFGTAVPETNPAGLGAFVQNLRFPGQVADGETGLFYNMARFYDPMIGRYVESDPIGLAGGINTYAYVKGNPLSYTDPLGLMGQASVMGQSRRSGNSCSCKGTKNGFFGQFGIGGSVQAFIGGVSTSVAGAVSTSGQACVVRTVCGRVGPGFYAGAGGSIGGGVVFGSTDSLGGFSVGIGSDLGFGPSIGGQATVGLNPGGSMSSVGGVKGHGGGGYGIGAGFDICYSWVSCTVCE